MNTDWTPTTVPFSHPSSVWIRPAPSPEAPLVVLCHGMGEDPERWKELWPQVLALPVHVVAPQGPYPFEIRKDERIRIGYAWYLYDGGPQRFQETVTRSERWLAQMLRDLESEKGWTPRGRALIGFSQGAYFGYVAALRNQTLFSHLVAVAGRLKKSFVAEALARPGVLQTLILHGQEDRAISVDMSNQSVAALEKSGYAVEQQVHPGDHRITPGIDAAAAAWLASAWALTVPPSDKLR